MSDEYFVVNLNMLSRQKSLLNSSFIVQKIVSSNVHVLSQEKWNDLKSCYYDGKQGQGISQRSSLLLIFIFLVLAVLLVLCFF